MSSHVGSKKDKKNAKDGGGVAAGKLTPGKFGHGSTAQNTPSNSSSSVASPDIRPVVHAQDANLAVSPRLDALSTASFSASTAASMNPEWLRGGLAGSPSNLISLTGESPPTMPSSYEDQARISHAWTNHRQFMSPQVAASPSPPNSFPNSFRRPLSYQQDALPISHSQSPASALHRASVQSPYSHHSSSPQPLHSQYPQAHFYGASDLDLDMTPQKGIKAGDRGYHFGFDTLPSPPIESTPTSEHVVVAGFEGGVDIFSVTKRGTSRVTGLRGLRGGVLNAKILPWLSTGPHAEFYPLIAVVIHGPVLPRCSPEIAIQRANDVASGDNLRVPSSPRTDASNREPVTGRMSPTIEFYQTSVELYSLQSNTLIDVLLEAPKISLTTPITSPIFKPPSPTSALTVKAEAGNIIVASGVTGEIWIFKNLGDSASDCKPHFGCAGKTWTTLQQPLKGDVAEEPGRSSPTPATLRPNPQTPIFAVGGRWLAHCPPSPSSQMTLRADVSVPLIGKVPGLTSVTAPGLPLATSVLDLPISESMVNKIMRETTQELISGAKWVGQQGMQAWNNYWGKNNAQQPRSPHLAAQQWAGSYPPRQDAPLFPPTHGTPGQAMASKDPGLVSIVDLDNFGSSISVHPITTFPTPLGCSFLSFSPTGLSLFTASSKGDVQTVWDLMRMQYTKSSPLQVASTTASIGPRVRQIAHFSRMTVARIVDVSWSRPSGERIAMVTEKGTVHLLDMPESAFTWPPPRRRKTTEANGAPASDASSAASLASTAFGAAIGAARPLIARQRGSSTNVSMANGANFVGNASQGGRAIAASISHSLGKTGTAINQLRHTGENRVSLPPRVASPSTSCVMWLASRKHHILYVVGSGSIRSFPSKTRQLNVQQKLNSQKGSQYKDYKLPLLPDDALAPAVRFFIDNDEMLDMPEGETDAGNTMTLDPRAKPVQLDASGEASIPQAEIESSAPYQPFHTDKRVALYEYDLASVAPGVPVITNMLAETAVDEHPSSKQKKKQQQQQQQKKNSHPCPSLGTLDGLHAPWVFGQKLDLVKLDLGHAASIDESFSSTHDLRALPTSSMERVMHVGENREEIIVTTRRRRGAHHAEDEDGFFEDDCEVLDFADQRV